MVFRKKPGTGKSPGKKSHPYFDYSRTRELGNSLASKFLAGEIVPRWRVSSSLTRKFTRELVREELVGEKVSRQRVTNSRTRDLGNSGTREKVKPFYHACFGQNVLLNADADHEIRDN